MSLGCRGRGLKIQGLRVRVSNLQLQTLHVKHTVFLLRQCARYPSVRQIPAAKSAAMLLEAPSLDLGARAVFSHRPDARDFRSRRVVPGAPSPASPPPTPLLSTPSSSFSARAGGAAVGAAVVVGSGGSGVHGSGSNNNRRSAVSGASGGGASGSGSSNGEVSLVSGRQLSTSQLISGSGSGGGELSLVSYRQLSASQPISGGGGGASTTVFAAGTPLWFAACAVVEGAGAPALALAKKCLVWLGVPGRGFGG